MIITPRPQREINFNDIIWIASSLLLVVSPHMQHFSLWLSISIIFILLLKLVISRKRIQLGSFIIGLFAFIALIGVVFEYGKILGRDAGVALLSMMLFLKLLETRTHRDAMVVMLLNYFLVITNFLYSQSIPMAVFMLLAVFYSTMVLTALNEHAAIHIVKKASLAGTMLLFSSPIMVLLFILFPRIPGPLWGLPADAYGGKAGLSEQMTPGSISELALSDEVAFRVKFDDAIPPTSSLYWRALILWNFDGKSWTRGKVEFKPASKEAQKALPVDYTLTLEPHNRNWLFLLDTPAPKTRLHDSLPLSQEYLLFSRQIITTLRQYKARSFLYYQMNELLDDKTRTLALALPKGFNPKALSLAKSWKNSAKSAEEITRLALQMFHTENFVYTLKPPLLGEHSVDEFLFETRRGFCEHYAGSFVTLMRAAGVPARVVTGYQGGEINPIDDYIIVRQADAHAWSEVWLDNKGWVRVDPTSAVSPARIETGLDAAINRLENPRFTIGHNYLIIGKLRLIWDAVNHRWNQWILGYGPEAQRYFLALFGFSEQNLYVLGLVTVLVISLVAVVLTSIIMSHHLSYNEDKVQKYYILFCKKLAKAGFPRLNYEGPFDYACRISPNLPGITPEIQSIIIRYSKLRYGNSNVEKTDLKQLASAIRRLRVC